MDDTDLRIAILGPLQIFAGSDAIAVSAPKHRALLALLALRPGYSATAEQLIDGLWGEDPPRSAQKTLQTYVSGLRRILTGDAIRTSGGGYELTIAPENIDAHRFEALVGSARKSQAARETEEAIDSLRRALDLWRGPALADVLSELPDAAAASRLDELRRVAAEDLTDLLLESGQDRELIPDLETAVSEEPMRERRWAQLMTALYRSGRQADALRTFQRLKTLLGDELGIEPSAELVQLEQDILLQETRLDRIPSEKASMPALAAPATNNLPIQNTSFVGRDAEIEAVKEMLGESRLVTLTGAGGAGKTRLALEVASRVVDQFSEGVWLVELATMDSPELVDAAVLKTLSLTAEADRSAIETLIEVLGARRLLVLLDNCEHLIGACAKLVDEVLARCSGVAFLSTSREPFGLDAEFVYRVPSLSLPSPESAGSVGELSDYGAIQLFSERARAHDRSFAINDKNASMVVAICHRIDGIPLAIELAAARLGSMSIQDINDRLTDRFRLLTSGTRTGLPRQQTLRALIDWSYDLLSAPERTVLGRLSVFVGGFDLEIAEQVCAQGDLDAFDVIDLVVRLVDKSLVQLDRTDNFARYRLLETVRQYAHELLSPDQARVTHDAHARAYLHLCEEAEAELEGPRQLEWMDRVEKEDANVRNAIQYFLDSESHGNDALKMVSALRRYWSERTLFPQNRTMIEEALAHPQAQSRTAERAWVLSELGRLLGDFSSAYETALSMTHEAFAIATELNRMDLMGVFRALEATIMAFSPDPNIRTKAFGVVDEGVAFARQSGDQQAIGPALVRRGFVSLALSNESASLANSADSFREALLYLRQTQNLSRIVGVIGDLANIEMTNGDLNAARSYFNEALHMSYQLKMGSWVIHNLGNLALLDIIEDQWDDAYVCLRQVIMMAIKTGYLVAISILILLLALHASGTARYQRAAYFHGTAERLAGRPFEELFLAMPLEMKLREQSIALVKAELGDDEFHSFRSLGHQIESVNDLSRMINDRDWSP